MIIEKCIKPSFTVIGKKGSTKDGKDFIQEYQLSEKSLT